MTLPIGSLSRSTIEVAGEKIPIRSLSRAELLQMRAFGTENADAAEAFMIAKACDVSEAEAQNFRESFSPLEVDTLLNAITALSGIDTLIANAQKNGGPKET